MIEIEHLQKKYGSLGVLKDINVTINQGDVISLIGPSGAGKSTFLRCLNLLEKPDGGTIKIDGQLLTDPTVDISAIRRRMGMVFQEFNLFEQYSVIDNLLVGPIKLLHESLEEAKDKAYGLLKAVGLMTKAESFPHELSGGQKQRVAIARCLSMNPDIILFDEPTSALDPTMVGEVLGVMRSLANKGMTMLIVTHEMNFARDVSSRILYLDEGIIYDDDTPDVIFNHPKKEKTRMFINSIRNFEYEIRNANYDFYNLQSRADEFAKRNYFNNKMINNLHLAIEETMLVVFDPDIGKDESQFEQLGGLVIHVEFEQQNNVVILEFVADAGLNPILPPVGDDFLSGMILKGITTNISESVNNNKTVLRMELKSLS